MADEADALDDNGIMDDDFDGFATTDSHCFFTKGPICKYCGNRDLTWGETKHGWRLFGANGTPHTCQPYYDAMDARAQREREDDQ